MAKEIAIGKRAKISEAQQYMMLAVFGASIFLGVAISLIIHFINQISFNSSVIAAEEKSIASYSDVIATTGVCKKPSGSVYSDDELNRCNPSDIEASEVPGTLRSNILKNIAANVALNSVPKENDSSCRNPDTGQIYTYKELNKIYNNAEGGEELTAASQLIRRCSALRVIPDALPSYRNEEALLASLNKLFILSGWEPESISPSGESPDEETEATSTLNPISVNLSIEADTGTTMNVLHNIERSIREFNIGSATIEWVGDNTLNLQALATAYYMDTVTIKESETSLSPSASTAATTNNTEEE